MSFEPLEHSSLWRRQSERYEALGQRAWSEGLVPWRASTCPLLADVEVGVIEAFARDAQALGWLSPETPLTVWDVGGGTGRLAFHLAVALLRKGVAARVLLTDVAEANVAAWNRHPQLAALREAGGLQTAVFDALGTSPPRDLETGAVVEVGTAVAVAHYLFDSLPHAAWRTVGGVHQRGSVRDTGTGFEWLWEAAAPPVALRSWLDASGDGTTLFPTGAQQAIARVEQVTGGRFAMLCFDKPVPRRSEIQAPLLARHETFSAGVNFEALAACTTSRWLPTRGGEAFRLALTTTPNVELPQVVDAWERVRLEPLEQVLETVRSASPTLPLRGLLEVLEASHDDPDVLAQLAEHARAALPNAELHEVQQLVAAVARAADRHFVFKQLIDVPFALATVAHAAGALKLAAALYRGSLAETGDHVATLLNLALVLRALGESLGAQAALERVLQLEPTHARALELLEALR